MATILHVLTVPDSLLFLADHGEHMRSLGHRLFVITSPGQALRWFAEREGVSVASIPMTRRITPIRDVIALARLVATVMRVRPDVVHAHTPKGGLLGMLAARMGGAPVRIYHMRGLPLATATGWKRAVLRTTERISCALATRTLCVSASLKQLALDEGIGTPDSIVVLGDGSGNGVDAQQRFNPLNMPETDRREARSALGVDVRDVVFGFVGRLVNDKGLPELVDAWALLRANAEHAHLVIVGKFEGEDAVSDDVRRRLASDPRVHLVGFSEDPAKWYSVMDVLVLPTHREGFPQRAPRGRVNGTPNHRYSCYRVRGRCRRWGNGYACPGARREGLASAMLRYYSDPLLRHTHGKAARRRVLAKFERTRVLSLISHFYQRELERGAPAAVTARPA